jgi:hypothetical protein
MPCRPGSFYSRLVGELGEVGWERVVDLSADLSSIDLQLTDRAGVQYGNPSSARARSSAAQRRPRGGLGRLPESPRGRSGDALLPAAAAGRSHTVRLLPPASYPAAAPAVEAALPLPLELTWRPRSSTLGQAVAQLEAALERHQQLWESLDDLDAAAWVVEPERPPRGCTYRRVALGRHVSLAVSPWDRTRGRRWQESSRLGWKGGRPQPRGTRPATAGRLCPRLGTRGGGGGRGVLRWAAMLPVRRLPW